MAGCHGKWCFRRSSIRSARSSRSRMPVLIVHGEEDRYVPARLSSALYAAAPQPKKLLLVPNGTHNNSVWTGDADYRLALNELFGPLALTPTQGGRECRTCCGARAQQPPSTGGRGTAFWIEEPPKWNLIAIDGCSASQVCAVVSGLRGFPRSPELAMDRRVELHILQISKGITDEETCAGSSFGKCGGACQQCRDGPRRRRWRWRWRWRRAGMRGGGGGGGGGWSGCAAAAVGGGGWRRWLAADGGGNWRGGGHGNWHGGKGWYGGGYRGGWYGYRGGWYGGWYGPSIGLYVGGPGIGAGAGRMPMAIRMPIRTRSTRRATLSTTMADVRRGGLVHISAPDPSANPANYWYYCADPAGYYPYVQNCSQRLDAGRAAKRSESAGAPAPQ